MREQIEQMAPPQARPPVDRARWWSSNRAHAVFAAASAIGLEILPVEAALIVLAAGDNVAVSDVSLPFWYGVLILAAAQQMGSRLRRLGSARVLLLSAPLIVVAWLLLLRVSPAAYGHVAEGPLDLQWLSAIGGDFANGASRLANAFGLLLVVIYLWYRGALLGTQPPLLDDVLRRFKVGLAVIVIAAATLAVIQTTRRGPAVGAFTFILPLEVFCGLAASALTRLAAQRLTGAEAERQRPWVSSSLALAAGVVGFALLLGLVVNGGNVSALLQQLGPVGVVLNAAVEWLTGAIGQIFGVVFGIPVQALKGIAAHTTSAPISVPPTCKSKACAQPENAPPPYFLIILSVVFYGFLLAILLLLFVRLYRAIRQWLTMRTRFAASDAEDERESLDGGELLRKQLRDLFRRRRPPRAAPAEDPLDPHSIRGLYRELLRAAARAGLPRLSTETPDEYAARATALSTFTAGAEGASDLAALSDAYDAARYGEDEGSPTERATAGERARRLVAQLRARIR